VGQALILPSNGRTRQVFDLETTASGRKTQEIIVENDAIHLTCFAAAVATGASISITIEQLGNNEDNIKVIRRLGTITSKSDEPSTDIFNVGGVIRITTEYTGAVTFDMHGRAVSGAVAAGESTQSVSLELTEADKLYRQEHMSLLCTAVDTLERILNHQRLITNIEKDKGETY
jgi:hypothetical protein